MKTMFLWLYGCSHVLSETMAGKSTGARRTYFKSCLNGKQHILFCSSNAVSLDNPRCKGYSRPNIFCLFSVDINIHVEGMLDHK